MTSVEHIPGSPRAVDRSQLSAELPSSLHVTPIEQLSDRHFEWLTTRHEFMKKKHWITGEHDDIDAYDVDPATLQLGAYSPRGGLVMGMRLTPVEDYRTSLSWAMVDTTPLGHQVAMNDDAFSGRQVWDLTRLVPGDAAGIRSTFEAVPRLFGEALRECQRRGDHDPLWVFLLDPSMERWLQRQEVAVSVVGRETINGDQEESVFAYIQPAAIAALQAHGFAHRAMGERE